MPNQLIQSKALKDVIQTDEVKNRLREIMGERAPQFAAALIQIVKQSNQLQKCNPSSVIGAALTAAALDLSIDPNLGMAHIVPYKDQAQFQIGYAGFAQLAQRSGQYKSLGWKAIHKGELESYDELTGELVYNGNHPDEEVIGYAAKFKLINGFERAEYWTVKQIEDHAMRYSKSYRYAKGDADKEANCLWVTSRDRMALKTVLKSLLKVWGPKSIQMQKALKVDDAAIVDAESEEVSYLDNPNEVQTSPPDFGDSKPVEEAPMKQAKKADEPKKVEAKPQSANQGHPVLIVRNQIAIAGISEEKVIMFLEGLGTIDSGIKTLEEIALKHAEVLPMVIDQFEELVKRIKEMP